MHQNVSDTDRRRIAEEMDIAFHDSFKMTFDEAIALCVCLAAARLARSLGHCTSSYWIHSQAVGLSVSEVHAEMTEAFLFSIYFAQRPTDCLGGSVPRA